MSQNDDLENLDDRIKELIDQRVEQRVQEELEKRNRRKQQEISNRQISRRQFLKKVGAGALGISALSLLPSASTLNIKSENLKFYGGQKSNSDFQIDQNGNINAQGKLNMNSNKITGLKDPTNAQDAVTKNGQKTTSIAVAAQ